MSAERSGAGEDLAPRQPDSSNAPLAPPADTGTPGESIMPSPPLAASPAASAVGDDDTEEQFRSLDIPSSVTVQQDVESIVQKNFTSSKALTPSRQSAKQTEQDQNLHVRSYGLPTPYTPPSRTTARSSYEETLDKMSPAFARMQRQLGSSKQPQRPAGQGDGEHRQRGQKRTLSISGNVAGKRAKSEHYAVEGADLEGIHVKGEVNAEKVDSGSTGIKEEEHERETGQEVLNDTIANYIWRLSSYSSVVDPNQNFTHNTQQLRELVKEIPLAVALGELTTDAGDYIVIASLGRYVGSSKHEMSVMVVEHDRWRNPLPEFEPLGKVARDGVDRYELQDRTITAGLRKPSSKKAAFSYLGEWCLLHKLNTRPKFDRDLVQQCLSSLFIPKDN